MQAAGHAAPQPAACVPSKAPPVQNAPSSLPIAFSIGSLVGPISRKEVIYLKKGGLESSCGALLSMSLTMPSRGTEVLPRNGVHNALEQRRTRNPI